MRLQTINENQESIFVKYPDLESDMRDLMRSYLKSSPAMSSDARRIKACKELGRKYKMRFSEILKHYRPDNNLSGGKIWDSQGNIK